VGAGAALQRPGGQVGLTEAAAFGVAVVAGCAIVYGCCLGRATLAFWVVRVERWTTPCSSS
jgi:ABC-type uncharacterized transport system permease subunit